MPLPLQFVPAQILHVTTTARQEFVDVTRSLDDLVAASGLAEGVCSVFCPHTSCGLALTEAEAGLHHDVFDVLEHLAPERRYWAHDDLGRRTTNLVPGDRPNGQGHMRALLVTQPQITVPIIDGRTGLGEWQRLFVVELDGGRTRRLFVTCWGVP